MQHAHGVRAAVILGLAFCPALAMASGFAITEHGGRGLGSAWAGEAAIAEDARTIYFDPAGMTFLPGTQLVGALDGVRTSGRFTNDGSHLNPAVGGGPLRGNAAGTAGRSASFRPSTSRSSCSIRCGSGSAWMRRSGSAPSGARPGSAATTPSNPSSRA